MFFTDNRLEVCFACIQNIFVELTWRHTQESDLYIDCFESELINYGAHSKGILAF